jgi:hypothetical protein
MVKVYRAQGSIIEPLFSFHGEFYAGDYINGGPTKKHQINDEILQFQKEFSALINFEKDRIKYGEF